MTREVSGVGPVGPAPDRREQQRRGHDRRGDAPLPAARAPVAPAFSAEPTPAPARPAPIPPSDGGAAVFAAQVMGQTGQRKGLKGGPPVLDAARSAYLGTKHSGVAERRPRPGGAKDTDV